MLVHDMPPRPSPRRAYADYPRPSPSVADLRAETEYRRLSPEHAQNPPILNHRDPVLDMRIPTHCYRK